MIDQNVAIDLLLVLLDGTVFANALRRNGKPCRIALPNDPDARKALLDLHLRGEPFLLSFHATGHKPWQERVDAVALAAFCPGDDGFCRWIGIDVDAADHGPNGLADPVHATRALAERIDTAGLSTGLLVARSRGGQGRHVFLILPGPTTLDDAVIGVAAIAAAAFKVAMSDVLEYGAQHAFRCANGSIARPGDAGAVELLPRSTAKPPHGWALALPCAGAFAAHGGGALVDPLDDQPIHLERIPRCDGQAWQRLVSEARVELSNRKASPSPHRKKRSTIDVDRRGRSIDRIDPRTRAFLNGQVSEGARNSSAFAASSNLLGCGVDPREAERLILAGATACGLPEPEARAALASATHALTQRRRG
ncbi:MAG: hypothetical protein IH987_03580 [Planctomycetes bacterium]|nr:hypothetical protein [Planctomycetota bacterium]